MECLTDEEAKTMTYNFQSIFCIMWLIKQYEAQHTRNFLIVCIAMVMVLGCVCVISLLRRNMQPLLAVLKKIGGEKGKGNE